MTEQTPEDKKQQFYTGKRPSTLTMLCILSFIGSGGTALSSLFVIMAYDIIPMALEQMPVPEAESMLELVQAAGKNFFAVTGLLNLLSLTGAILMWKLRKTGFHLYTIAQLLLLAAPLLMIAGYQIPFTTFLLTGTFILGYGLNIRFMR
ncbi:hypothetical protein [Lentimicrobium sp.]|jgi:hypothetical protein|uniref:hypothetical protein n=1 Tax=Lentimicrobium sp. TaxID=2034841 RepID=UPI0025D1ABA2|nr:hypothetical protein [Lentimicrobium sp.]MCO5258178.1 hypothetical protein [Lentimicrobium sp.]HOP12599.1 hypothetical protein [Lentimicrobium sp.]HPF65009.1 hypothetical protein [Lentimicrobium sp.]HPJ62932.1 hypothetical protein [Lentimicrobium sp.]HPR26574.1 hypothetical protein [Lentimicrobium sp.]